MSMFIETEQLVTTAQLHTAEQMNSCCTLPQASSFHWSQTCTHS